MFQCDKELPMSTIKDIVVTRLKEIETSEKVKILYAVESGSRAWGFAAKDSDYDVRFIYTRPLNWYLSLEDGQEVIERPLFQNLDIQGWDIKKALKLFKNANPALYEWLHSSIVYREERDVVKLLRDEVATYYSPGSLLRHYERMARGQHAAYLTGKEVHVKKYFYALRPLLACMWIEKENSLPPMEFEKIFAAQKLTPALRDEIEKLLRRKRLGEESQMEKRIELLDNFLEEKIRYFETKIKILQIKRQVETDSLDTFFRDIVKMFDN